MRLASRRLKVVLLGLSVIAYVVGFFAAEIGSDNGVFGPFGLLVWPLLFGAIVLALAVTVAFAIVAAVRGRGDAHILTTLAAFNLACLFDFWTGLPSRIARDLDFHRLRDDRMRVIQKVQAGEFGPVASAYGPDGGAVRLLEGARFSIKLPADLAHTDRGGWIMAARDGNTTYVFFDRERWLGDDVGFLYRSDQQDSLPPGRLFAFVDDSGQFVHEGIKTEQAEPLGEGWFWAHWLNYD
jgi:hypothetical protein